jgi:hypothetical protein
MNGSCIKQGHWQWSLLLRIGISGGLLWTRRRTFGFHEMLTTQLLASWEGCSSMELASWLMLNKGNYNNSCNEKQQILWILCWTLTIMMSLVLNICNDDRFCAHWVQCWQLTCWTRTVKTGLLFNKKNGVSYCAESEDWRWSCCRGILPNKNDIPVAERHINRVQIGTTHKLMLMRLW